MIFSTNRAFSVGAYRDPTYQKCRLLNKVSPSRSYIVKTNRPIAKALHKQENVTEKRRKTATNAKPRLHLILDRFFVAANV